MGKSAFSKIPQREDKPKRKPNILSIIMFSWLTSLFKTASKRPLQQHDLPDPVGQQPSKLIFDKYHKHWKAELTTNTPKLWKSLLKSLDWPIIIGGFVCGSVQVICQVLMPVFLYFLLNVLKTLNKHPTLPIYDKSYDDIKTFNSKNTTLIQKGPLYSPQLQKYLPTGLYILGIVLASLIGDLFKSQMFYLGTIQSSEVMSGLTGLVYNKILMTQRHHLDRVTSGHVLSLVSKDLVPLQRLFNFGFFIPLHSLQVLSCIFLMWKLVGIESLISFAYLIFLYMCVTASSKLLRILRHEIIKKTDQRLQLVTDIIAGIRLIKINVWEPLMEKLIGEARSKEISLIFKSNLLRALSYTFYRSFVNIAPFLVITAYIYTGKEVDPTKVFTLMTFLCFLPNSLYALWFVVEYASFIQVSIRRIQKFLLIDDIEKQSKIGRYRSRNTVEPSQADSGMPKIILGNVYCTLNCNDTQSYSQQHDSIKVSLLCDINLEIEGLQLLAVIGKIGSGKSSLLNVILRELPIAQGEVSVKGTIALVSQKTWLFTGTIRDNIIFGKKFDEKWFNEVIRACALDWDLKTLPQGDLSYIGEHGVRLSGGQRARVGLARAVYHNADIYLLDDPLSALDSNVGSHVFQQCIKGLLHSKLRILVTHHVHYLEYVDKIVIMDNGSIAQQGTYDEVFRSISNLKELMKATQDIGQKNPETQEESIRDEEAISNTEPGKKSDHGQKEEDRAVGSVSYKTYREYIRSGTSISKLIIVMFIAVLSQVLVNASYWWLTYWSSLPKHQRKAMVNLYVYCGLAMSILLFYFLTTSSFLSVCLSASKELHTRMVSCILQCPVRFFDTNPAGRIINRFAKDTALMDDILVERFLQSFTLVIAFLSILVSMSTYSPVMIIPCCAVMAAMVYLARYYLRAAREVERLRALSSSPLYEHFVQTFSGADAIRAFDANKQQMNQMFSFQDDLIKTYILSMACNMWIAVRLFVVMSIFTLVVAVVSVLVFNDSASVGLLIFYTIEFIQVYTVICDIASTENAMTSVERIIYYTQLEKEPGYEILNNCSPEWPRNGSLSFNDVTLTYYPGGPEALKGINMTIDSGEKVGIVGRTGAGKSSIMAALFRLPQSTSGSIVIDDAVIENLNLQNSRAAVGCIPQNPFLFKGNIRFNLDPSGKYSTQELLDVLEQVQLKSLVASFPQGLEHTVNEEGSNFSVGERQLFCLARALLQRKKIVILDEATANVDFTTDQVIQDTIRHNLKEQTVIAIAHRLDTVLDYDKVIVVEDGKVVEVGKPSDLLDQSNSKLACMYQAYIFEQSSK